MAGFRRWCVIIQRARVIVSWSLAWEGVSTKLVNAPHEIICMLVIVEGIMASKSQSRES